MDGELTQKSITSPNSISERRGKGEKGGGHRKLEGGKRGERASSSVDYPLLLATQPEGKKQGSRREAISLIEGEGGKGYGRLSTCSSNYNRREEEGTGQSTSLSPKEGGELKSPRGRKKKEVSIPISHPLQWKGEVKKETIRIPGRGSNYLFSGGGGQGVIHPKRALFIGIDVPTKKGPKWGRGRRGRPQSSAGVSTERS